MNSDSSRWDDRPNGDIPITKRPAFGFDAERRQALAVLRALGCYGTDMIAASGLRLTADEGLEDVLGISISISILADIRAKCSSEHVAEEVKQLVPGEYTGRLLGFRHTFSNQTSHRTVV
jgi:hypothetical protein